MTTFATTSKTIRLALALTVLTPVPLLAETLTARQMLAQAQSQAVTLPGETKKPVTTELAKLEVGKSDLGKTDLSKGEPAKAEPVKAVDLAPPLPVIAPPAPVKPILAAPIEPAPDAAKPSIASITVLPAPPLAITTPAPVAVAAPVAMRPAVTQQPAPAVPIADAAPAQMPAAAPMKPAYHDATAKTSTRAPREKVATRRPRGSRAEPSFNGGGSIINSQMISRIMQRPEVQSLIAQYGAQ